MRAFEVPRYEVPRSIPERGRGKREVGRQGQSTARRGRDQSSELRQRERTSNGSRIWDMVKRRKEAFIGHRTHDRATERWIRFQTSDGIVMHGAASRQAH